LVYSLSSLTLSLLLVASASSMIRDEGAVVTVAA
jgi:hypothetical protein